MSQIPAVGMKARVLSPFYYHSLAVPSGTASLPDFLTDRSLSFAMGSVLGALCASPALPAKDYAQHLRGLPLLASVFETRTPGMLQPLNKRLNLDGEGGFPKTVQDATYTGNLKTHFYIQEIAPGIEYTGAVFGADPFELASKAEGRPLKSLVVRTGRHLTGMLLLEPWDVDKVRLNAHTAALLRQEQSETGMDCEVEIYALHDLQLTPPLKIADAASIVASWRAFGH